MLTRVLNKVKRLFGNNTPAAASHFPYIHHQPEYKVSFVINNPVEEFRLRQWGGEKEYVMSMMNELRPNDILFDVGSSVGLISVIAAKLLQNGKVVSFEPDPENTARLKENYRINHIGNASVQQMAVGNEKSVMRLYTGGSNNFSPSLQKVNGIEQHIDVAVNSIDDLIAKGTVPYPTVVKIDIEGAEMMALQGMQQLLKHPDKPRLIFVEVHPDFLPSFGTSREEIMQYLQGFDYVIAEEIERDKQVLCKLVSKSK